MQHNFTRIQISAKDTPLYLHTHTSCQQQRNTKSVHQKHWKLAETDRKYNWPWSTYMYHRHVHTAYSTKDIMLLFNYYGRLT